MGRFVPEKGFHDLIEAFQLMQDTGSKVQDARCRIQDKNSNSKPPAPDLKLVIVGDADHQDNYSLDLKEKVQNSSTVILTGFLTGKPLQELYSNAGLFVIPSYYEGLPIVLLEAMSYGLPCIASDIPANRNVALSEENYFEPGNITGIVESLNRFTMRSFTEKERKVQLQKIVEKYNWEDIAKKTLAVYKKVVD